MSRLGILAALSFSLVCAVANCTKQDINKPVKFNAGPSVINEVEFCNKWERRIAEQIVHEISMKYYDSSDSRPIEVYVEAVRTNYLREPVLADFLQLDIEEYIGTTSQCKLSYLNNPYLKCIVRTDIIHSEAQAITIISRIIDAKTGVTEKAVIKTLNKNCFLTQNFNYFKARFVKFIPDKTNITMQKALLTIRAINDKTIFKEDDRYIMLSESYAGTRSDYIFRREGGYSGFYPMEQRVRFSGKDYPLRNNGIFFEGYVDPGTLEIVAEFVVGFWDADIRQQKKYEAFNKKFKLRSQKNDVIHIDIFFSCDGRTKQIIPKAYKKVQIEKDIKTEPMYEIIQIFSD